MLLQNSPRELNNSENFSSQQDNGGMEENETPISDNYSTFKFLPPPSPDNEPEKFSPLSKITIELYQVYVKDGYDIFGAGEWYFDIWADGAYRNFVGDYQIDDYEYESVSSKYTVTTTSGFWYIFWAGERDLWWWDYQNFGYWHWVNPTGEARTKYFSEWDQGNNVKFYWKVTEEPQPQPDLIISDVSYLPTAPEPGIPITFTTKVKNQGDKWASYSYVYYYIDGSYVGSDYVSYLSAGSTSTETFLYTFVSEGTYTFKAVADATDRVSEKWEGNNSLSKTVIVQVPKPDLVVTDISYTISQPPLTSPEVRPTGYFTVRVKNQGGGIAGASYLDFYIGGSSSRHYVPQLSANSTYDITRSYTFSSPSTYSLKAVADERGEISETDETNNERTGQVTIGFIFPDLEVTSISYSIKQPPRSTLDVYPGDVVNFTVELRNGGQRMTPGFYVDFYVGGSREDRIYVSSLSGGSTWSQTFEHRFTESGDCSIKAVADATGSVWESNEGNNERSESTIVRSITPLSVKWSSVNPLGPVEMNTSYTLSVNVKNPNNVPLNVTIIARGTGAATNYGDTPIGNKSQTKVIPKESSTTFTFTNYSHYWRWLKPVEEDLVTRVVADVIEILRPRITTDLLKLLPSAPRYLMALARTRDILEKVVDIAEKLETLGKARASITYRYAFTSTPHIDELNYLSILQTVVVYPEKPFSLALSWITGHFAGEATDTAWTYSAAAAAFAAAAWFFGITAVPAKAAAIAAAYKFAEEGVLTGVAEAFMEAAYGSPDPNYQVTVVPQPVEVPELDLLPEGPERDAAGRLLTLLTNLKAMQSAWSKYQGAAIAGDTEWMLRHLSAAQNYANLVLADLHVLEKLVNTILLNLQKLEEELAFPITEVEFQTFREWVRTEGLPSFVVNAFKEVGYSNDDIATITEIIQNVPVSSYIINGRFDTTIDEAEVHAVKEVIKERDLPKLERDILQRLGYTSDDFTAVKDMSQYVPDNAIVNHWQNLPLLFEGYSVIGEAFANQFQDPTLLPEGITEIPVPTVSVVHSPDQPTYEQSVTFTVTSSDELGVTRTKLYVDGVEVATWPGGGTFTYVGGPYIPGTHTYSAVAINSLGYMGGDPAVGIKSFKVIADITPPTSSVNTIEPYWHNKVPFVITATATDDLSGVENVALWYRYSTDNAAWGNWLVFGTDDEKPYEWEFNAQNEDGYYEFYTIATDQAGNVESPPENADARAGVDTAPPTSSINPIELYWQNTSMVPFGITAVAEDPIPQSGAVPSGLKQVELYYRYSTDNVTWSEWLSYETDNEEPWSWAFDASKGDGYYEFYTIATDVALNVEAAPEGADARAGVDTIPPASHVNPIEPYWREELPFTVSAAASDDWSRNGTLVVGSGVANVKLYYRSSIDNLHWTEWRLFGVDDVAPYEWSFTAPDGYALYEFYSVATDVALNVEEAPEVADASCGVVIPATIDIDPNTLNLNSGGKWITAYIELPPGYDVAGISIPSVELEGAVPAESDPKYGFVKDPELRDRDGDGLPELMVKFDRAAVQALVEPADEVELTITGMWHAVKFKGTDTIRVIDRGQGQENDHGKDQGSKPEVPPGQSGGAPGQGGNQGQGPPQVPPGQGGEVSGQGPPDVPPGQGGQSPGQSNDQGNGNQGQGNEQGNQGGNEGNKQGQGNQGNGQGNGGNNGQGNAKGK